MRRGRRFGLSGLTALGLTLVIATNVAASSTGTVVNKNICTTTGAAYGYGKILLRVTSTEYGLSGVNKFKFIGYLQYATSSSGPWTTVDTTSDSSPYFANTAADTSYYFFVSYPFRKADKPYWFRLKITTKFLDRDGTTGVVATTTKTGQSCSP